VWHDAVGPESANAKYADSGAAMGAMGPLVSLN
jgi:hypothetical protein